MGNTDIGGNLETVGETLKSNEKAGNSAEEADATAQTELSSSVVVSGR